jgi:hypothetical protein
MTTEKALQILSSAYNVGATVEERTAGTRLYEEVMFNMDVIFVIDPKL